jgi:hypothetical protein
VLLFFLREWGPVIEWQAFKSTLRMYGVIWEGRHERENKKEKKEKRERERKESVDNIYDHDWLVSPRRLGVTNHHQSFVGSQTERAGWVVKNNTYESHRKEKYAKKEGKKKKTKRTTRPRRGCENDRKATTCENRHSRYI